METQRNALNLIWGADEIAKAINRPVRATYHMLESGSLPGAAKVGGRWCFDPEVFREFIRKGGQDG